MSGKSNLKNIAAKGLFWSGLERFGSQGIQLVFGIFITRLLDPTDYGLLGMILIFIAVGQTLVDGGFSSALIWKKNPSLADYSTVFFLNISISLLLYSFFFFLAPLISRFYNEPLLVNLIRVISLNFVILSFSLIQQTVLQKKVDFKLLTFVNITGSLVAGILSLYMAFKGYGVWAITVQILAKSFITSIMLWIFNKWRPVFVFDWLSLKELFSYGSKLTIAGLIYTVFQYLYFNIIGKLFPVAALGFYTRAAQLQEFPVKTGASIFSRVLFPVFSNIQDDKDRLLNAIRKSMTTIVFVMFPVIFGLIALSDQLIVVLFTNKWISASLYFKLLLLTGIFYILQVINGEILKTKGKSNLILKLEIINKTVMILMIFVTWKGGISAIIWGQIISYAIAWIICSYYVSALVGYSLWKQLKDIYIYLLLSLSMFLIATIISQLIRNPLISIIITSITGSLYYFVAAWMLKLNDIQEIKNILKR